VLPPGKASIITLEPIQEDMFRIYDTDCETPQETTGRRPASVAIGQDLANGPYLSPTGLRHR